MGTRSVLQLHCAAIMRTAGRVLVVDDYAPNLDGLRRLLERQGYEVLTASNGHDALEIVTREHPDLDLRLIERIDRSGFIDNLYRERPMAPVK